MVKQRGSSMLGMISGIALLAISLSVGLKVGPLYLDNNALNTAISSAAKNNFDDMTKSEIREQLSKTFRVNNVSANPRDFEIEQAPSHTEITYVHEERATLFDNVEVVITFTNHYSTAD